jgi:hypothetical protein
MSGTSDPSQTGFLGHFSHFSYILEKVLSCISYTHPLLITLYSDVCAPKKTAKVSRFHDPQKPPDWYSNMYSFHSKIQLKPLSQPQKTTHHLLKPMFLPQVPPLNFRTHETVNYTNKVKYQEYFFDTTDEIDVEGIFEQFEEHSFDFEQLQQSIDNI